MKLAKSTMDVGLFTTRPAEVIAFWKDEVGAVHHSTIAIGEGHDQHRLEVNGSLLKINAVTQLLDDSVNGYAELIVASDGVDAPRQLVDPDGNRVTIAPKGHRGVQQLGIVVEVADVAGHSAYFRNALGLDATADGPFAFGDSSVILSGQGKGRRDAPFNGRGYRYLSVESSDIQKDHADYVAGSAGPGGAIQQIGTAVRFALLQDPDGNWLEIVQRAAPGIPFEPLDA